MYAIDNHKPFLLKMFIITIMTLFIFQTIGTYLDAFDMGGADHIVSMSEGPQYYIVYSILYFLIPYIVLALILVSGYRPVAKALKEINGDTDKHEIVDIVAKFEKATLKRTITVILIFMWSSISGFSFDGHSFSTACIFIFSRIYLSFFLASLQGIIINFTIRREILKRLAPFNCRYKINPMNSKSFTNVIMPLIFLLATITIYTDTTLNQQSYRGNRYVIFQSRVDALLGIDEAGEDNGPPPPTEEMLAEYQVIENGYIFYSMLFTILFAITFFLQYRLQASQMKDVLRQTQELSEGQGDLTKQIEVIELDEIATMIMDLNQFIVTIREKIGAVETATKVVDNSSDEVNEQLTASISTIKDMGEAIEQINLSVGDRVSVVERTKDDLNNMVQSFNNIKESVDTQSVNVEQTSASIAQMVASINSVTESTERADILSGHLKEAAKTGEEAVNNSISAVKEVEKSAEAVNGLVSAIQKIASQTNLLAMNAAIEAAHAGDVGKGFAVVAQEVRNLAESSALNARQITDQIKAMVELTNHGVAMSENAGSALTNVINDVTQTSGLIETIALSMKEQNMGAGEILDATQSLVDSTHSIKDIVSAEMENTKTMSRSVDEVVGTFHEVRESGNEQNESIKNIMEYINRLEEVVNSSNSKVKSLSREFSDFKLR